MPENADNREIVSGYWRERRMTALWFGYEAVLAAIVAAAVAARLWGAAGDLAGLWFWRGVALACVECLVLWFIAGEGWARARELAALSNFLLVSFVGLWAAYPREGRFMWLDGLCSFVAIAGAPLAFVTIWERAVAAGVFAPGPRWRRWRRLWSSAARASWFRWATIANGVLLWGLLLLGVRVSSPGDLLAPADAAEGVALGAMVVTALLSLREWDAAALVAAAIAQAASFIVASALWNPGKSGPTIGLWLVAFLWVEVHVCMAVIVVASDQLRRSVLAGGGAQGAQVKVNGQREEESGGR